MGCRILISFFEWAPVVRMSFHHQLAPSAPLGDVLVELDCRGAGPEHAGAGGVHVGQVVECQDVTGLKMNRT